MVNVPLTWYILAVLPLTLATYAVAPDFCPVTKSPEDNPDVAAVWLKVKVVNRLTSATYNLIGSLDVLLVSTIPKFFALPIVVPVIFLITTQHQNLTHL